MERPNQGIPHDGNPSPFSSWGEVGAPHMATLSLPGLTIGLPIWLFSTNVVQNTMVPEQSSQQLDQSRAAHQPSTSYNSSSNPSSSQGRAGKSQAPMEKKEKKKKRRRRRSLRRLGASKRHLTKIHTQHRPGLNRHVSYVEETTSIEIVPVFPGY
jgi:hypothetical protein